MKVAHNPLTRVTLAVATIFVAESSGDGESMAAKGIAKHPRQRSKVDWTEAHGGIRVRSVLDPQPGHVGFFKVVSTVVQCSPLRLHCPVIKEMLGIINP